MIWHLKSSYICKLAALFLALALVTLILFACGGGNEEPISTPTATLVVTATPTPTTTPTTTPSPSGPVKIGAIHSFSGPSAVRSEEHTSELQSRLHLVCRLL